MSQVDFAATTSIPADGSMNSGLTPTSNSFMLNLLGVPGKKTENCSNITNAELKAKMVYSVRVAPGVRISGLSPAVEAVREVFRQIKAADPRLYAECKTAGMLCCRLVRGSDRFFSNHSWGSAIDFYFGEGVVPLGTPKTHVGVLKLYPYMHAAGFYWGAEFSRRDAMHFECSAELLRQWRKQGLI
jgi:hypothetical protein